MEKLIQNNSSNLIQTKKTVQWLIENTDVSVFNPVEFTGYQRQIDAKHCAKIVKYLEQNFMLPTSIICASDEKFTEASRLRIVDGQHRVAAFRRLKEVNPGRYNEIKNYELSVIVMETVPQSTEIETFITINKTSKKVDTSLAYVLKNKLNYDKTDGEMTMPKSEYLAVELARKLNEYDPYSLWYNKIIFEGTPKNNTPQLISLNQFVRSTRVLLNTLAKQTSVSIMAWNSQEDIQQDVENAYEIISEIWETVYKQWPGVFRGDNDSRRILQGAIGYTAINKVITDLLKETCEPTHLMNMDQLKLKIQEWIYSMKVSELKWEPGGPYSGFSSEAGFRIVAKELRDSIVN